MILTFLSAEIAILKIVSKLLIVTLLGLACWVPFRCFMMAYEESQPDSTPALETQPELQTYHNQEIEELKKKYDAMEEKPKLYYDPYSGHVYLCKNGEKAPVGDIKYLQ